MVEITTIIFGAIGAIVLAIIIFQIAKALKGSVKIKLDRKAFSSSEFVTGAVILKTRKEIQSNRLFVELEAKREERRRDLDGKISTSWRQVYSQEANLEGEKNYTGGLEQEYKFKIKVPTNKEIGALDTGNNIANQVIKVASMAMGVGRLRWRLRVRLDAKGVDLTSSKKVHVNMSDGSTSTAPSTM